MINTAIFLELDHVLVSPGRHLGILKRELGDPHVINLLFRTRSELSKLRGIGRKSLDIIEKDLLAFGFHLRKEGINIPTRADELFDSRDNAPITVLVPYTARGDALSNVVNFASTVVHAIVKMNCGINLVRDLTSFSRLELFNAVNVYLLERDRDHHSTGIVDLGMMDLTKVLKDWDRQFATPIVETEFIDHIGKVAVNA